MGAQPAQEIEYALALVGVGDDPGGDCDSNLGFVDHLFGNLQTFANILVCESIHLRIFLSNGL